jgi:RHS repeat-associated protein
MCIEPTKSELRDRIVDSKVSVSETAFAETARWGAMEQPASFLWTWREREVDEALMYQRARHYDPSVGRWISNDPLGYDACEEHLYPYVTGDPDPK